MGSACATNLVTMRILATVRVADMHGKSVTVTQSAERRRTFAQVSGVHNPVLKDRHNRVRNTVYSTRQRVVNPAVNGNAMEVVPMHHGRALVSDSRDHALIIRPG